MITGIITFYLVLGLIMLLWKLAGKIIQGIAVLFILPAYPFLVAQTNWESRPVVARMIVGLWGFIYFLFLLACIYELTTL